MKKRAMKKWIPKGVYCYDTKRGKYYNSKTNVYYDFK